MIEVYYHFTGDKLRDGKAIPAIGEWLVFEGDPVPCKCGLHASAEPFDALQFAPGSILHKVELAGKIEKHGNPVDKFAAQRRRIISSLDATEILRLFSRRVALDVIHLWDAPPVVMEYLETGDESIMAAAEAAARAAAEAAARAAAWAAARDAAWAAAIAAAWADASAAASAAARAAAWAAAWAAAIAAASAAASADVWADVGSDASAEKQTLYRQWFNEMVEDGFRRSNER